MIQFINCLQNGTFQNLKTFTVLIAYIFCSIQYVVHCACGGCNVSTVCSCMQIIEKVLRWNWAMHCQNTCCGLIGRSVTTHGKCNSACMCTFWDTAFWTIGWRRSLGLCHREYLITRQTWWLKAIESAKEIVKKLPLIHGFEGICVALKLRFLQYTCLCKPNMFWSHFIPSFSFCVHFLHFCKLWDLKVILDSSFHSSHRKMKGILTVVYKTKQCEYTFWEHSSIAVIYVHMCIGLLNFTILGLFTATYI